MSIEDYKMCYCWYYLCSCVLVLQLLWTKDMHDRLVEDELAKNVPDADKLLEVHQERKVS